MTSDANAFPAAVGRRERNGLEEGLPAPTCQLAGQGKWTSTSSVGACQPIAGLRAARAPAARKNYVEVVAGWIPVDEYKARELQYMGPASGQNHGRRSAARRIFWR